MSEVVTFGEAMVRLAPPHFQRLEQTRSLDVEVGGGELNVAVAVSRLGLSASWVSRLPDNPLGRMIRNRAREHGVDTSHMVWGKGRAGLYFVEFGASPRASSVLYDRAHSAFSQIQTGEVDWDAVLRGCRVFHTSGISPALSPSAAAVTGQALQAAKKAGALVSYDLNYRAKLWSPEEARRCQEPLMESVDFFITTEEDTRVVFGIVPGGSAKDDTYASVSAEPYKEVAQKLAEKFRFQAVAITLRENPSVWRNTWTAIAYAGGKFYEDRKYDLEIVDRVGGGDAFSAGFLYGYLTTKSFESAVRVGNASAALKHTNPGDFTWATRAEVEALLQGPHLRVVR